jgi:hypothetical protein
MTAAQLAATSPLEILPLPPAFATIHLLVAESAIPPDGDNNPDQRAARAASWNAPSAEWNPRKSFCGFTASG